MTGNAPAAGPATARFGAALEAVVKALGALTGAAAIAYALGALVVARSLQASGLSWRDTMSALPREQILASGTIELAHSLLGALLVLVTGSAFLVIVQTVATRRKPDEPAKVLLAVVIVFLLLSMPAVPFDPVALICLALVAGLSMWLYAVLKPLITYDELVAFRRDLLGRPSSRGWSHRPLGWIAFLLTAIIVVLSVGHSGRFRKVSSCERNGRRARCSARCPLHRHRLAVRRPGHANEAAPRHLSPVRCGQAA